jgi:REP element-mobilizing transposase RayT
MSFYRRNLPHFQRDGRAHFITFATWHRLLLSESSRCIALDSCQHDHGLRYDLHAAVVMPDHVHLILTPMVDLARKQVWTLPAILDAIKGASAHRINASVGRKGHVWQDESFDHVLRSDESLIEKIAYIRDNPVRAGLVERSNGYRWSWVADPDLGRRVGIPG